MPKSDLWNEYKAITEQTWEKIENLREYTEAKKETYKKGIGYLQATKALFIT